MNGEFRIGFGEIGARSVPDARHGCFRMDELLINWTIKTATAETTSSFSTEFLKTGLIVDTWPYHRFGSVKRGVGALKC